MARSKVLVAPAWIETYLTVRLFRIRKVGGVDRNVALLQFLQAPLRRPSHGGVDRNLLKERKPLRPLVAPHTGGVD
ncbi:hypothetical protein CK223_29880 [Mesorhizobium loti]|nr:hypothetical protein CK223_29880 [Mesorhizobium loti]